MPFQLIPSAPGSSKNSQCHCVSRNFWVENKEVRWTFSTDGCEEGKTDAKFFRKNIFCQVLFRSVFLLEKIVSKTNPTNFRWSNSYYKSREEIIVPNHFSKNNYFSILSDRPDIYRTLPKVLGCQYHKLFLKKGRNKRCNKLAFRCGQLPRDEYIYC